MMKPHKILALTCLVLLIASACIDFWIQARALNTTAIYIPELNDNILTASRLLFYVSFLCLSVSYLLFIDASKEKIKDAS